MIQELVLSRNEQAQFLDNFKTNIKNASIYPKWAVLVFILSLLISFGSLFYAYTVKQDIDDTKKEVYQKGVDTSEKYINQFFESHPKTKMTFDKWKRKITL